jgi:Type I restriction-modification system methyltransferase subunit
MLLVNASKAFAKGTPKNYITDQGMEEIVSAFLEWKEIEGNGYSISSKIVTTEEIAQNDYNISPSRYIHIGEEEEYRPIGEIWEEIEELNNEAKRLDESIRAILEKIL